jgi:ribosomal-protein-alanine N-acetyltransferase
MSADLEGDLEIVTSRFVLEPLNWSDAPDILAHFADPEVIEFLDIEPLSELEEAEDIIAWARSMRADGQGVRWAIREREAGAPFVGTCGFNSINLVRGRRGEVAYDLVRRWWGRGVMAELMPVIIDFGFGRLGLHRLEALVTPGNQRSCSLLERHGFALEGTLRDYGFWRGRYWDQLMFGRVAGRPP